MHQIKVITCYNVIHTPDIFYKTDLCKVTLYNVCAHFHTSVSSSSCARSRGHNNSQSAMSQTDTCNALLYIGTSYSNNFQPVKKKKR